MSPARHETQRIPELNPSLVAAYCASFVSRHDCYPIQVKNGTYVTIKKPLTLYHQMQHIRGALTLGAYGLDAHSQARWLCLDADEDANWQAMLQLAGYLHQQGITPYIELSRRGGHVWLFFDALPGEIARRFGQSLLQRIKASPSMELYPKQDRLTSGVGSLVRLPLGIHRKSGKRYHFITLKGEPLAPTIREQMRVLSQPQRIPRTFIDRTLAAYEPPQKPQPRPDFRVVNREAASYDNPLSERIKTVISVHDFVSRYVALDANGRGLCPFHDDQHRSFGVHPTQNYWHCWAGCGGGSVIDFWMRWRETHNQSSDFTSTVTELAQILF